MELPPDRFKRFLPLPVTLVTTVDEQKIVNAAPYSCVMPILRPFELIALASALPRDTLRNIRQTGEFVVNVMGRPGSARPWDAPGIFPRRWMSWPKWGLRRFPPGRWLRPGWPRP